MSEPPVDRAAVRHVATLARIDLDEEAIEQYQEDFVEILEYFDRLDSVPDVPEQRYEATDLRADEVTQSLDQRSALSNTDRDEDGFFTGPPVS